MRETMRIVVHAHVAKDTAVQHRYMTESRAAPFHATSLGCDSDIWIHWPDLETMEAVARGMLAHAKAHRPTTQAAA